MVAPAAELVDDAPRISSRGRAVGLLVALAALLVAIVVSVLVGSKALDVGTIVEAFVAPTGSDSDRIVHEIRVPRTLAAILVGAALGGAGALIQAFTRNPLGDPGVLGVNAGAMLSVTIGVAALGTSSTVQHLGMAFAGALVATVMTLMIGAIGRSADPIRLTLAGVAIGAVLTGIATAMMLMAPMTFRTMRSWAAGSLVDRGFEVTMPALPAVAVGLVIGALCARPLNAMGLGDELAAALGANVTRTRVLTVVAITLLAGAGTAVAGPIGFIGLMVPHVARWVVGPDQGWIFPLSVLMAPVLLLVSDVAGRVLLWPGEVPVGIVTAFIGAPVLIALVRRRNASTL